nr:MAG TPA: hypothetical protein [Herelleviridae sp.]
MSIISSPYYLFASRVTPASYIGFLTPSVARGSSPKIGNCNGLYKVYTGNTRTNQGSSP